MNAWLALLLLIGSWNLRGVPFPSASSGKVRLNSLDHQVLMDRLLEQEGPEFRVWTYPDGARVLFIAPDEFVDELAPLVTWKTRKGLLAKVVPLSETDTTAEAIRAYIQNAYQTWDPAPEYVVLVGDVDRIPAVMIHENPYGLGPYPFEGYYGCVEGDDEIADLFVGRISVQTAEELRTVVAKILAYERTPFVEGPNWLQRALFMAGDIFDTSEAYIDAHLRLMAVIDSARPGWVFDTLFWRLPYWESDSFPPYGEYAIRAVTYGTGLVNYRGTAWGNLPPPWDTFSPNSVLNRWKPSVMFLLSCGTATFYTFPTSFDEAWLRAGTPETPRGAATYVGLSASVAGGLEHTLRRNEVNVQAYRALFLLGIPTVGAAMDYGRLRMLELFPEPDTMAMFHYREVTVLGDPTLFVWTARPESAQVLYPPHVPPGTPEISVTVLRNGLPVPHALVALTLDSAYYAVGYTDSTGNLTLPFGLDTTGVLHLVVTGTDILPFLGEIHVFEEGPLLLLQSYRVEALGDPMPFPLNPGDSAAVRFVFTNEGTQPMEPETLYLHALSEGLFFQDTLLPLPALAPGDTLSTAPLRFQVGEVPDGTRLLFALWGNAFSPETLGVFVHSSRIFLESYTVTDASGDGFVDPGESGSVVVTLGDLGNLPMTGAWGRLRTSHPWVQVTDSLAYFGRIAFDQPASNADYPFAFRISDEAVMPFEATFTVRVQDTTGFQDSVSFPYRFVGREYLLIDLGGALSSRDSLYAVLHDVHGLSGTVAERDEIGAFYNRIRGFERIFLTGGTGASQIPHGLVDSLVLYLENGGKLFVDGFLNWGGYIPLTPLMGFMVSGIAADDTLRGLPRTFASGMRFVYQAGLHAQRVFWVTDSTAFAFLENSLGNTVGVARDAGEMRSVALGLSLGFLEGQGSVRQRDLIEAILTFLDQGYGVGENRSGALPGFSLTRTGPASWVLTFSLPRPGEMSLTVFNAAGRRVWRVVKKASAGRWTFPLSLQALPAGVYFLRAGWADRSWIRKLLVIRE